MFHSLLLTPILLPLLAILVLPFAMYLEVAFLLRLVLTVFRLVPGNVFIVDICAMLLEVSLILILCFVGTVRTAMPGHVFVVDSCAMLLEMMFVLRFVVAVLTVVPGHVVVVDS